jgi:hypothetical protein
MKLELQIMNPVQPGHFDWREDITEDKFNAFKDDLKQKFQKTSFYTPAQPEPPNYNAPMGELAGGSHFSLWMPGMALLAGHLAAKKDVKNLYVAKTMEDFSSALRMHITSQESFRAAYIISPSFSGCTFPINFPQHKLAVVVEKSHAHLKIAILDSMPVGRQGTVDPEHIQGDFQEDLWKGYDTRGNFNAPELVLRAVLTACAGTNVSTENYYSKIVRNTHYGCEIFAIYDALVYLKNPLFFQQLRCEGDPQKLSSNPHTVQGIVALPAIHMRGVQSLKTLQVFKETYPELYSLPLSEKNTKSLEDALKETVVNIGDEKNQNRYITKKGIKYLHWVVDELQNKPNEAQAMIDKMLLKPQISI